MCPSGACGAWVWGPVCEWGVMEDTGHEDQGAPQVLSRNGIEARQLAGQGTGGSATSPHYGRMAEPGDPRHLHIPLPVFYWLALRPGWGWVVEVHPLTTGQWHARAASETAGSQPRNPPALRSLLLPPCPILQGFQQLPLPSMGVSRLSHYSELTWRVGLTH